MTNINSLLAQRVRIGVVCLTRHTFDYQAAEELYKKTQDELKTYQQFEWIIEPQCVVNVEDAERVAQNLAAQNVDALIIISGTFHLGHLALTLTRCVGKPVLLWAYPELPYNGGKIRLNSVCGLNLNASNLYKAGFDHWVAHIGEKISEPWLYAVRMKALLERAHIGLVGYRAHGFFNLQVPELALFHRHGILVDHYEIQELYACEVTSEDLTSARELFVKTFAVDALNEEQKDKTIHLIASAKKFVETHHLHAVAVRCWPEFAATYGVAPCAAFSVLQSLGLIFACEGDIEGALSQLALSACGAETPFLADLSQVNFNENFALMWHCGVAPSNLWDGVSKRAVDTYFAGGKGVTADFVLRSGKVTVMRIDSARGKTRLFWEEGEALPMEQSLKGTYAKVRFHHSIQELLHYVLYNGVAHHVAFAYGSYGEVLKIFARIMGYESLNML